MTTEEISKQMEKLYEIEIQLIDMISEIDITGDVMNKFIEFQEQTEICNNWFRDAITGLTKLNEN